MKNLQHYLKFVMDSLKDYLADSPVLLAVFAVSLTILLGLYLTRSPATPASQTKAPDTKPLLVRLPAAEATCAVCFEEPKGRILRCSNCKNQFYCSQACQSKDWKSHKFNCSLLPSEGLGEAQFENKEELRVEAGRVSDLMKRWLDIAHKYDESKDADKLGCARLPEAREIAELTFPSSFAYAPLPPSHGQYPFRVPLVLIGRLFLMDLIASVPSAGLEELAKSLDMVELPSHIPRVFGPKVISRPADLSPGEYENLGFATMIQMSMNPALGLGQVEIERWISLRLAHMKLWNAPRSVLATR